MNSVFTIIEDRGTFNAINHEGLIFNDNYLTIEGLLNALIIINS